MDRLYPYCCTLYRGRDWPDAPSIFIAFNPKGSSDSEWVKSPTSPLDIKTFSGVGITGGHQNSLDPNLISPQQQRETIPIGSPHGFIKSNSQNSGMENSESYTCVISRDSNSSTNNMHTHRGIQCEIVQYPVQKQDEHEIWDVAPPARSYSNVPAFPVAHFLRACCLCKRQLNHGKDIYMYRGDMAFCSEECRYQQILMDDEMPSTTDFDG